MTREIRIFLEDIMESIGKIEEYTRSVDRKEFLRESWVQDAVIRRLEIIGEAVKNESIPFLVDLPKQPPE